MKKYLLLLHEDAQRLEQLSPQEMGEVIESHMKWAASLSEKGYLMEGEGLEPERSFITGKEPVIRDGNYLETKEMIGGFYLLQVPDHETAVAVAKDCPCHYFGGTTEIRAIMNYES